MESGRQMFERLQARRVRHLERSRPYRIAFAAVAFLVVIAGVLLIPLPGPGLVVIAVGLFMLALEFAWAERLLGRAAARADRLRRRGERDSRARPE